MRASPVSTTYGLGLLLLNTRQGRVQLNTERRLLRTLPEAQVQVIARVSPHLRHVSSVQTTGPRMGRNVAIEVPEQFKAAERFPLIVEALNAVKATTCLIDGEAVTCDESGVADFDGLRYRRGDMH